MKIRKAIALKNSTSFIGICESGVLIQVSLFRHLMGISFNKVSPAELYEEDTDNYYEVSIHTFHRALRVAKYRIDKDLSEVQK